MEKTIQAFAKEVKEAIEAALTEELGDFEILAEESVKNNEVVRNWICIKESVRNMAPVFYLEDHYCAYVKGEKSAEETAQQIIREYYTFRFEQVINFEELVSFEKVRDRVIPFLVSTERNDELFKEMANIEVGPELSAVFKIMVLGNDTLTGSMTVNKEMIKSYGVNEEELLEIAIGNIAKNLDPVCISLNDILRPGFMEKCLEETGGDEEEAKFLCDMLLPDGPLHMISGKLGVGGAAVVLDEGFMEKVGEKLSDDYLLLIPSSVHEMLVFPTSLKIEPEEINQMIVEVNSTLAYPEDVLSDISYGYDVKNHRLYRADDEAFQALLGKKEAAEEESVEENRGRKR